MYRIANEFKTRIDEWFKWRDVFIVGLEYCSTNILKISLRAVNVEVLSPSVLESNNNLNFFGFLSNQLYI